MEIKIQVKNGDLVDNLSQKQKGFINNKIIMPKYKMTEPNDNPKEGEYGWIESELESDNLLDAMEEALAKKDIFIAEI